jgi:hypothetical protein
MLRSHDLPDDDAGTASANWILQPMTKTPAIQTTADVYLWLEPQVLEFERRTGDLMLQLERADLAPPGPSIDVLAMEIRKICARRELLFSLAGNLAERIKKQSGEPLPSPERIAAAIDEMKDSILPADLAAAKAAWVGLQATEAPRQQGTIGFIRLKEDKE